MALSSYLAVFNSGYFNDLNSGVARKKVLILGTLPEIITITSTFLYALGVPHECILPLAHDSLEPRASCHVSPNGVRLKLQ